MGKSEVRMLREELFSRSSGLEGSKRTADVQPWLGTHRASECSKRHCKTLEVSVATGWGYWPCPAVLPWPVLPSTALNPLALHN